MTPPSKWTTGDKIAAVGVIITLLGMLVSLAAWMNSIHALANTTAARMTEMVQITKEASREAGLMREVLASHAARLDGHDRQFERIDRGSE